MPRLISSLGVLLFFMFYSCTSGTVKSATQKSAIENNVLKGSWEIEEIYWHTKDTTYSIEDAQPGYFLFTKSSYALMWTRTQEIRTAFVNLSKPTSEEKIEAFQSVVFNSGKYQVQNDSIVSTAMIAKVPGFEGGRQFYTFRQEEDRLHLLMYDETYPDGTKPEWSGIFTLEFNLKKASN